jgi:hypothetical protein
MNFPKKDESGSVLQSFDEQFPDVQSGFKSEDGMAKAFGDFDCDICGRRTPWFHFEMAVYLCSQNCLTRYLSKQT